MKTYIGTKIIQAEPMDKFNFAQFSGRDMPDVTIDSKGKSAEGYKVIYPDGYISWSPKEQFEIAYREITNSEKGLINGLAE